MGIEVISLLLSAGTAAMIMALVKAWRTLRAGAVADEKDYLEMTEERRRIAETDRDVAIAVANYWRARSGVLEYLLNKNLGPESIPEFPKEPGLSFSQARPHDTAKDGTGVDPSSILANMEEHS